MKNVTEDAMHKIAADELNVKGMSWGRQSHCRLPAAAVLGKDASQLA